MSGLTLSQIGPIGNLNIDISSIEGITVKGRKKKKVKSSKSSVIVRGGSQQSGPCPMPADLARAYQSDRKIAMDLFQSIGGDKEVAYTIFRNNSHGNLETYFEIGNGASMFGPGSVNPTAQRPGLTPVMAAHIHDAPTGSCGLLCWAPRGASPGDMATSSQYTNITFVLNQKVNGKWEDSCF